MTRRVDKGLQFTWDEAARNEAHSPRISSRLEAIAPQLFDIDPCSEPEKPLPIDLGLDQIEDVE